MSLQEHGALFPLQLIGSEERLVRIGGEVGNVGRGFRRPAPAFREREDLQGEGSGSGHPGVDPRERTDLVDAAKSIPDTEQKV